MPARRLMLGLLVAGALLVGTTSPSTVAAQSCDPAYVSHCIPPVADIGDLNCQWLYDQGIPGIVLADSSNDPHGLDGSNSVDYGYGCEGDTEEDTNELAGTQGIVAPAVAARSDLSPNRTLCLQRSIGGKGMPRCSRAPL